MGLAVALGVAACVVFVAVGVGSGLGQASAWAAVLGFPVAVVAAVAAVRAVVPSVSGLPRPAVPVVPGWVVGRPDEAGEAVAALLGGGSGMVGLTTGLHGAGGFGKTTLAEMIRADPRVRDRFAGGVYWVTVGRDVRGAGVAAKVNDLIRQLGGTEAGFSDPGQAGQRLGSLLEDGPWRLLIVDDVWEDEQLAPFTAGGRRCARLVTTRVPGLLAGRGAAMVLVDQMSLGQARAVLTAGLAGLDAAVESGLLAVTGRWPLLLRLVNKILASSARAGQDVTAAGRLLLERLRAAGPAAADDVSGAGRLDVSRPEERARAVRATIEASTGLLGGKDAERFGELAVFAEDEVIPFGLVARLWAAMSGLDELRAAQLCTRLEDLALVSPAGSGTGGVVLHDVIRDFLRAKLGPQQLATVSSVLLSAAAARLPAADPPCAAGCRVAWWELGDQDRYMRDHLIGHLLDAGMPAAAEDVACDLRWAGVRVRDYGPAAAAADLALAGTPRAARLSAVLTRAAHLLAPTDPAGAVIDILHSRVSGDPDWAAQAAELRDRCPRPRLVSRRPPPDLPGPEFRRALTGHESWVTAVAIAPDGTWLATASHDKTARIWNAATGGTQAILTGHRAEVTAVAIAPDGTWLATASEDRTARIWDAATGLERGVLPHNGKVHAVAIAPDGTWLATASVDGARIWDTATMRLQVTLTGHRGPVNALDVTLGTFGGASRRTRLRQIAQDIVTGQVQVTFTGGVRVTGPRGQVTAVTVAPDGTWLATGGHDGTARIWDTATGAERATLAGGGQTVDAVAIAPDGRWLATAGIYKMRIWDTATWQERAIVPAGNTKAIAIAPDGTWLATTGCGTTATWDSATGRERSALTHRLAGYGLAIAPDGRWLATADDDRVRICDTVARPGPGTPGSLRIWHDTTAIAPDGRWLATASGSKVKIRDAATWQERATLPSSTGRPYIWAIAIAPDGSWLAAGAEDGTVRAWSTATWQEQVIRVSPGQQVRAVAIAPDGSWLATVSGDGTMQTWDTDTRKKRATFTGRATDARAMAIAPDGSWFATAGLSPTVRIWDSVTGQDRGTLPGNGTWLEAVAIAPDARWLATASNDGTVCVWDLVIRQPRAMMRIESPALACSWLGTGGLAVASKAGLHTFDFLTATATAMPGPATSQPRTTTG